MPDKKNNNNITEDFTNLFGESFNPAFKKLTSKNRDTTLSFNPTFKKSTSKNRNTTLNCNSLKEEIVPTLQPKPTKNKGEK